MAFELKDGLKGRQLRWPQALEFKSNSALGSAVPYKARTPAALRPLIDFRSWTITETAGRKNQHWRRHPIGDMRK
jgi:hypothetical protein